MTLMIVAADGGWAEKCHLCGLISSPEVCGAVSVTAHSLIIVEITCLSPILYEGYFAGRIDEV